MIVDFYDFDKLSKLVGTKWVKVRDITNNECLDFVLPIGACITLVSIDRQCSFCISAEERTTINFIRLFANFERYPE